MPVHPIAPVFDRSSEILILGSFPSVRSRAEGFFYGHPQNRFWRVLTAVYGGGEPRTVEEKKSFLLDRHIALWDIIASCDIEGSSDSTIRNVVPNDIGVILAECDIKRIFVNGGTAGRLYGKYIRPTLGREAVTLPSTSPANASWPLKRLTDEWRRLLLST